MKEKLVPVLGNYGRQEPHSQVIIDNASIFYSDEVVEAIENVGAKVLYTSPYSPELNPIENMFGEYKKGLRRYSMNMSWNIAHLTSLNAVTPRMARGFFRGCGVDGCDIENDVDSKQKLQNLLVSHILINSSSIVSTSVDIYLRQKTKKRQMNST